MKVEVTIIKEWEEDLSGGKYGKPFYCVYNTDTGEFVDIIGNTKSNTISKIRQNGNFVYRGKFIDEKYL
ncbi:MAG: hypothetical protein Unbinned5858contig1001_36 [Prokaryotic dsDNA virus sp.]|nr:MAG: hypothetical protein Unbinned5858contig1001_36 [Prokaryotic dsDNA virus sp.]|tara:strand:- start:5177 stop:5383 length:207 start_codon:yes stop_codon:yes gene_type:complete